MGGTDDRAECDPGLVDGCALQADSCVLVPASPRLARVGACETVEEAETAEASAVLAENEHPFESRPEWMWS